MIPSSIEARRERTSQPFAPNISASLISMAPRSLGLNDDLGREAGLLRSAASSVEEDLVWISKEDSLTSMSTILRRRCPFFETELSMSSDQKTGAYRYPFF